MFLISLEVLSGDQSILVFVQVVEEATNHVEVVVGEVVEFLGVFVIVFR